MNRFRLLHDPGLELCGNSAEQFLRNLDGPTGLFLPGVDATRSRAFVTLLHGNEPSGLLALRRWLQSGQRPAVNVLVIVASVHAALAQPLFSHRMLPGARDLNRCFRQSFNDNESLLASDLLGLLDEYRPEAVVDMHNTSGSGPSFGVVNHIDVRHEELLSLFTDRVVISSLNLGALMELSDDRLPVVTIEVGGRLDDVAHELAWQGMQRYFLAARVVGGPATGGPALELLHHPIRLELEEGITLGYGEGPLSGCSLTLRRDIEQYNFESVDQYTCLGWVSASARELFRAIDADGRCAVSRLLQVRDGRLYPAQSLKLFMITGNASIAQSDCLCYAVADDSGPLQSTV